MEGVEVEVKADVVVEAVKEAGVVVEAVEVVEVAGEVVVVEAVEEVEVVGAVVELALIGEFGIFMELMFVEDAAEVADAVAVGFTSITRRIYTWRSVF